VRKGAGAVIDVLLLLCLLPPPLIKRSGDQVIRENPAGRGTETSAEVLVGPPGS